MPPEELAAGVPAPLLPGAVVDLGDGISIEVVGSPERVVPFASSTCSTTRRRARRSTRSWPTPRAPGRRRAELAELRREYDVALRLRELIARQRAREAEMRALYETASDLTAIRDVDAILAAIVRRARQLLNADMTYLSLNDEAEGASYMKVTDGALTPEFRELRLPLGTGLLGLVAQTGAPYFTEDYQSDERFVHRELHRRRGRRREDPGDPRRPAGRRRAGDRRAARGAPHGAAVPARARSPC